MVNFNILEASSARDLYFESAMPRKPLIETDLFPYHITNRSNNKEFFYLELEELWQISVAVLYYLRGELGCEIHGFVLMSNHYHLLISTPRCNLSEAMTYFHREIAKRANREANRVNHFFGGRYKWNVIKDECYYWSAVKYVFRNPVQAGVCHRVEDFRFSSLNDKCNSGLWKMVDKFTEGEPPVELDLDWLNDKFEPEHQLAIMKALRRREFALPTDVSGRATILDSVQRKKGLGTKVVLEQ